MTTRNQDISVEKQVAKRLDAFYTSRNIKFQRVTDRLLQFAGVDLYLETKTGKKIPVDEKAKYHGLQNSQYLNTYSFEISRICRDGVRRLGWFVDKNSQTELYCYAFPKFDQHNNIKSDMLVELFAKRDIKHIVENEISIEELINVAQDLADNDQRIAKFKNFAVYKTPSYKLYEEPINLLISRELITQQKNYKNFYA